MIDSPLEKPVVLEINTLREWTLLEEILVDARESIRLDVERNERVGTFTRHEWKDVKILESFLDAIDSAE